MTYEVAGRTPSIPTSNGMRSPSSRTVLLIIAGALLAVITVIVGIYLATRTDAPPVSNGTIATPAPRVAAPTIRPADSGVSRSPPASEAISGSPSPPPAMPTAPTGRVLLDIKPWGEVLVDGKARGLSPPLKTFTLPEGKYRIEVRNPAATPLAKDVEVKSGRTMSIAHTFQ